MKSIDYSYLIAIQNQIIHGWLSWYPERYSVFRLQSTISISIVPAKTSSSSLASKMAKSLGSIKKNSQYFFTWTGHIFLGHYYSYLELHKIRELRPRFDSLLLFRSAIWRLFQYNPKILWNKLEGILKLVMRRVPENPIFGLYPINVFQYLF